MKPKLLASFVVFSCVALVVACDTDADQCESLCRWVDECTTDDDDGCSEYEVERCAEDVEDVSDGCEDAFSTFMDCIEQNENDCNDIAESCQGERDKFVDQCGDEI